MRKLKTPEEFTGSLRPFVKNKNFTLNEVMEMFNKAIKAAQRDTLECAAENARTQSYQFTWLDGESETRYRIDKSSILNLIEETKQQ